VITGNHLSAGENLDMATAAPPVQEISKRSPLTPAEVSDRSSGRSGFLEYAKIPPTTAMTGASDTGAAAFWITLCTSAWEIVRAA